MWTKEQDDFFVCSPFQLDADRDEEEVFCDISMTLDNKLFPSKEPAAGEINTYFIKLWDNKIFFYGQTPLKTAKLNVSFSKIILTY